MHHCNKIHAAGATLETLLYLGSQVLLHKPLLDLLQDPDVHLTPELIQWNVLPQHRADHGYICQLEHQASCLVPNRLCLRVIHYRQGEWEWGEWMEWGKLCVSRPALSAPAIKMLVL